ncbi:hypothetical protein BpHYR1_045955 [Brachionus plicatilis]|uniref:Uncharacterized protein n=1 Tax=Brachionus plicatilis TaxID=10195 RepID=A0A3M7T6P3_BRAPC|nr:hypothetical protein BpHYR1_045955 [Brachionus plicatilis]
MDDDDEATKKPVIAFNSLMNERTCSSVLPLNLNGSKRANRGIMDKMVSIIDLNKNGSLVCNGSKQLCGNNFCKFNACICSHVLAVFSIKLARPSAPLDPFKLNACSTC